MNVKPLGDRLVIKNVQLEETTKSGSLLRKNPRWLRCWPWAPAAWWTARKSS